MAIGRIISFFFGIIVCGLLQVWVVIIVLLSSGKPVDFQNVIGNGGLFFFSTSLVVGSALNLFDKNPIKLGTVDFNMTMMLCGMVLFLAVSFYMAVLFGIESQNAKPFSGSKIHLLTQILCALCAISYWCFVCVRRGMFNRDKDGINS